MSILLLASSPPAFSFVSKSVSVSIRRSKMVIYLLVFRLRSVPVWCKTGLGRNLGQHGLVQSVFFFFVFFFFQRVVNVCGFWFVSGASDAIYPILVVLGL